MSLEEIIISLSYFGIFILIMLNGVIGFPSSQLIYIVAGYFASKGDLNLFLVIGVGAVANSIGNLILYEISRRKGLDYTLRLFKFLDVLNPKREVKKIQIAFRKRGSVFLFIGKLVNPIKIFISIPAGISKMNRVKFFVIVLIASGIWASVFSCIGYYFGKSWEKFGYYGAIMFIVFIIVIIVFYKYINSNEILEELGNERN